MKKVLALALAIMGAGACLNVSAHSWSPFGIVTNEGDIQKLTRENDRLRREAGENPRGQDRGWNPANFLGDDALIQALEDDNKRLEEKIRDQQDSDDSEE